MSRMCGTTGIVPTRIDGERNSRRAFGYALRAFFVRKHDENRKKQKNSIFFVSCLVFFRYIWYDNSEFSP